MSKIGVGIGEDFPVDDGKPREDRAQSDRPAGDGREGFRGEYRGQDDDAARAAYAARREAHHKWREQRREWKRQWRDEWRARRDEFRDSVHGGYDGRGGHRRHWGHGRVFFWSSHFLWRAVAIVLALAVIAFFFSHIYFILGALVLLALFAAATSHRRRFDAWDGPRRGRREETPPASQPPRDAAH